MKAFFQKAWAFIKANKLISGIIAGVLAIAIVLAIVLPIALGGSNNSQDKAPSYTAYEFTLVYENGDPATDISVQLCTIDEATGALGSCFQPVKADANGKVVYSPAGFPGAGVYEIHLLDASYQAVEFEGETKTTSTFASFTLTIKK